MTTLTDHLKHKTQSNNAASPAFFISQSENGNGTVANGKNYQILTYDDCWDIVDQQKRWLLKEIHQVTRDVAANDQAHQDVIVGYLSDNSPNLLTSLLGCIDLTKLDFPNALNGIIPAMMNVRWTPLEIARVLSPKQNSSGDDNTTNHSSTSFVTILLYGDRYEKGAAEAIDCIQTNAKMHGQCHCAVALALPSFTPNRMGSRKQDTQTLVSLQNGSSSNHDVSFSDAILLFTSGTSSAHGIPKGVRLSHKSLFVQAFAKTQYPCYYDQKTVLAANTVPLFHVGGLSSLLAVLLGGGSLVFPDNIETALKDKGFQPELVLESLSTGSISSDFRGVNTLVVVPAMLHSIYEQIRNESCSSTPIFSHVRLVLVGGQSLGNGSLYSHTRQYFPNARIVQTYACTEAGSSMTFEDLGFNNHKCSRPNSNEAVIPGATCVGLPPAHIQIGIFGDKKEPLSHDCGEVGIIGTRGTHVMSGYWNRGDTRTQSIETIHSRWMFTSDVGYIDANSGKLYFCGRVNDVIRTGGESVLATEVEDVIGLHPDIADIAVFALPHEKFGEVVCAAVVTRNRLESDELQTLLRHHCTMHNLAGFKHPRRVFCMQSLPRNSSGKVLKQSIAKSCSQMLTTESRL
ncbi:hypothetical protein ACHAXN_009600 [Cyclotella atomus]